MTIMSRLNNDYHSLNKFLIEVSSSAVSGFAKANKSDQPQSKVGMLILMALCVQY